MARLPKFGFVKSCPKKGGDRSLSRPLYIRPWAYKRWGHLGFLERGNLRKGGIGLETWGMTPLTKYGF